MRRTLQLIAVVTALFITGCGDKQSSDRPTKPVARVTVALDFTPNAVHAPLYMAKATGADRRHGLDLSIRQPGSGPDGLKLVVAGKVDIGILDIQDLALAREQGTDVVGIGALVQKPLAALLAQPGITRPKDLNGKTVGVSGLPSDPAFLKAIVDADGGDYKSIKQVVIGFKAVAVLLTKRVDAVPAFWSAEGVALAKRGHPMKAFHPEDYGAPAYPEVVFVTTRKNIEQHGDRVKAFLQTVKDGEQAVAQDPAKASSLIATAAKATDTKLVRAQLDAVLPTFSPPLRFDRDVLTKWGQFDAKIGILKRAPDVDQAFDLNLAP